MERVPHGEVLDDGGPATGWKTMLLQSPFPILVKRRLVHERRSFSDALNSTLLTVVFLLTLAIWVLHLTHNRFMAAPRALAHGEVWKAPSVWALGNYQQPVVGQPRVERGVVVQPRNVLIPNARARTAHIARASSEPRQ